MSTIKTAVILAAGLGSRLGEITKNKPKCLVEINDRPILDYQIDFLSANGFTKIVIVCGYKADMISNFIRKQNYDIKIEQVYNHHFESTNNIYSLWMAFARLRLNEGFLLLESDLMFEADMLRHFNSDNAIALNLFDSEIHLGTTATVRPDGYLKALYLRPNLPVTNPIYKTVNICSFANDSVATLYYLLDLYVRKGDVNIFYEKVIHEMVVSKNIDFKIVDFSHKWWDEIDNLSDLERVKTILETDSIELLA